MIQSLIIENFQSHKNSTLEFDKGVNIIVGQSDSGKTAIIRALRWLIWGRPLGNAFCTTGTNQTSVTVNVDGIDITRNEGKEKSYVISTIKEPFRAFGTTVPEEVLNILNLSEINLQSQLDQPFLLSNSPGDVAQHFNKIARLDKIDTGLQNVQRWIKEISKEIDFKTTQKETSQIELEKFNYLEKFEIDIEVLEEQEKALDKKQKQVWELQRLIAKVEKINESIITESKLLPLEPLLNSIFEKIESKQVLVDQQNKLNKLIRSINQIDVKIEENNHLLKIEILLSQILTQYESKGKLSVEKDKLKNLCQKLILTGKALVEAEKNYEALHKEFEKNFPSICPLCGK
jgi:DNA repair exonuclease SbcCD ATPase subunit